MKVAYKLWHECIPHLPKHLKYTFGETTDKYFVQTIENILIASFLQKQEKQPFVRKAIISLDVVKFFLYMLWDLKNIEEKRYVALSYPLAEAGKMLGGWHNQLENQTNPEKKKP